MSNMATAAQLRTLARLWFGIGLTRKAGEDLSDVLAKMNMTELDGSDMWVADEDIFG